MNAFKITDEIEHYIKLQRTGYGDNDISRCYYKDILKDYESIKEYLPKKCKAVLDIGCGIGGIDIMIHNHYKNSPFLNMYDFRCTSDKIYYGYNKYGAVYNSLEMTADFLKLNGVDRKSFEIYDAHGQFIEQNYDVIISLLSCGFHYPVTTYLDQIKKCKSGVIILDIRKHSNQIELLKDNFSEVKTIMEWSKGERVLIK